MNTIPAEQTFSAIVGSAIHLGPPLLFIAILSTSGIAAPTAVAAFFLLSLVNLAVVLEAERRAPCVELPEPRADEIRAGLSLVFAKGVLLGGAVVVGGWWLLGLLRPGAGVTTGWLPIFVAVALTDAIYYGTYRWLNHGRSRGRIARWFRTNHVTHHLVPHLDFMRGNHSSLFDTAVTGFQIPLVFLAAVLGLDLGSTLTAYGLVLMLQATHHVNHTFNLGVLRYVFMDNHAHKLHHCKGGRRINHGALFSVWDRVLGTYFEDWSVSANYLAAQRLPLPAASRETPTWSLPASARALLTTRG